MFFISNDIASHCGKYANFLFIFYVFPPTQFKTKKFGDIKNFIENIHSYEATTTGSQLVKYKIQVYNDLIKKT